MPKEHAIAKEIMTPEVLSVEPGITIQEAAELMDKSDIGAVVVLSPIKDLIGIFTERDLLKKVVAKRKDPAKTKIEAVMTRNVMVAQATDDTWELLEAMARGNFRHLPVVDGRRLVGILSLRDCCDSLLQNRR